MRVLDEHADARCGACERPLCGHEVLFALAAGFQDDPLCVGCLAEELDRAPADCESGLRRMVRAKECLRRGWRVADVAAERSGAACCGRVDVAEPAPAAPDPAPASDVEPYVHDTWDAGDLGCGELVLKLRLRLRDSPGGAVLRLRATDPGAPEDIPAWCRLTGHALVRQDHPHYWIRRRD